MEHLHSLHEKAKLEKSNGQLSHLSKDVIISPETGVSARLFIPKLPNPNCKLPLLIYIHGGGFSIQSAFSTSYNHYVKSLVAEANVIALSVDYRLAPEHPIPACYDDSWAAVQWAASHANGDGPDTWLNNHADFSRVFFAGDSAGGEHIEHTGIPGRMWLYMCPNHGGLEDPRLKPGAEDLARLGCERVLMFVAEKDHLRPVAWDYYEKLKKSEWKGTVEIVENHGRSTCSI
ncbi:putative carboxylesterase 13 [Vitis vinifera]|uniref:Putative carboxylesterase 13 n=1 Tax=Vitis vinifera TaxID=29760 RepID=A0A438EPM7_VITVI|nr:putative carboxylesterase 13 [Vitis vinifera]